MKHLLGVVTVAAALSGLAMPSFGGDKLLAPTARIEEFLGRVAKGEVDSAVDALTVSSALRQKPMDLNALKGQIKTMTSLYGAHLGDDLVRETKTKDYVVHYVYVSKYEQVPLAWHFYFFRPHDQWVLLAFFFGDLLRGFEQGP